ncbi:MAG: hypothetical protein E7043_00165 [Lentisphaerae bacterium]|nr:hypothetical protein [Lentisphaerota bacterium]
MSGDNKIFTDSEIEEIFAGLDEKSIFTAKRFMNRQRNFPPCTLIHPSYYYTDEERKEFQKLKSDYKKSAKKYHFSIKDVGPESLYYHHGLRFAPAFVKEHLKNKVFVDAGGYLGDSVVVFSEYSPSKIAIFEPMEKSRCKLLRMLKKNHISNAKYDLYPFALSDVQENFLDMECRALDDVPELQNSPIGLLKADIEGMGLKFLIGAKNTIIRNRPLLSLSIYHNEDEFVGIYQALKSWGVNYSFSIKQFSPLVQHGEYSLFAFPSEWEKE